MSSADKIKEMVAANRRLINKTMFWVSENCYVDIIDVIDEETLSVKRNGIKEFERVSIFDLRSVN